jgi:plastocyanin
MTARMRPVVVALSLAGVFFAAACGSTSNSGATATPTGGGRKVDAATAGAIDGQVKFEGTPPVRQPLKMGSDPACESSAGPNPTSDAVLVGSDGSLQNVFVYVKDGLEASYSFDPPKGPMMFDQKGCRYVPHVFGVRVGQPIEFVNNDDTMHNVHALPKTNDEFNQSLQIKGQRMTRTFTKPEVMVRFTCDVHKWMTAYIGVLPHPYFSVTNDKGAFDISGLPPGTYTLEAWHERFGTQTQKVTVGDRQTQTVSFTFKAAQSTP